MEHPKQYLKILWAFPAWMKMTPVLTCMWGTCCQVPDREVFPGPGKHLISRDLGKCWNIESDEPWRKVITVMVFHGFSAGLLRPQNPSHIRSENQPNFAKNKICITCNMYLRHVVDIEWLPSGLVITVENWTSSNRSCMAKASIASLIKVQSSQFQCNKRFSKIFEPLHTYNIDIQLHPWHTSIKIFRSCSGWKSRTSNLALAHAHRLDHLSSKIDTEVRLIWVIYIYIRICAHYVYIYIFT